MNKIFGKIVLSENEYNAQINQVYMRGYNMGYNTGRTDGFLAKVTPNEIRRALDLEPMEEGAHVRKNL